MEFEIFSIPAAGLITLTSFLLLLVKDWRANIGLLAIQYFGAFFLIGVGWPLILATTALLAGWMACSVLGMAVLGTPETSDKYPLFYEPRQTLGETFYILVTIFMGLTVISVVPQLTQWNPSIEPVQAWGGLMLVGLGLLRSGFTSYPLAIISGLLTVLSGFEVLYAPMESSPFSVGLLATVTLGIALSGAYLYVIPNLEDSE